MPKSSLTKFPKNEPNNLFQAWLEDIKKSSYFSEESGIKQDNFLIHSKTVYDSILETLQTKAIPDVTSSSLSPLFELWHQLIKAQKKEGFSTKDTAMLLYSLKSTFSNYIKKAEKHDEDYIEKFRTLLDVLGVMTFEIYSAESESIMALNEKQISYLNKNAVQFDQLIGTSPEMSIVYKAMGLVLENDLTVLLEGESGTGKDLIATTLHAHSKRKDKPFIVLNCGAIPKDLIESELFGHEKGAFTGAESKHLGKFELAHTGTLFLDEIGELTKDLQVKLLRAIQNQEFERVGGQEKVKVDVRIIAATNKDLKKEVDAGNFRLDLYYRLNVFPIYVPALRERKKDIIPLAQFFLDKYSKALKITPPGLTEDAVKYLIHHTWEGNIRELENLMQRALVISQGHAITSQILRFTPGRSFIPEVQLSLPSAPTSQETILPLDEVEKQAIIKALEITNGNILQVAKALGVSRTTLYNKLEKYNIEPNKNRG